MAKKTDKKYKFYINALSQKLNLYGYFSEYTPGMHLKQENEKKQAKEILQRA